MGLLEVGEGVHAMEQGCCITLGDLLLRDAPGGREGGKGHQGACSPPVHGAGPLPWLPPALWAAPAAPPGQRPALAAAAGLKRALELRRQLQLQELYQACCAHGKSRQSKQQGKAEYRQTAEAWLCNTC